MQVKDARKMLVKLATDANAGKSQILRYTCTELKRISKRIQITFYSEGIGFKTMSWLLT